MTVSAPTVGDIIKSFTHPVLSPMGSETSVPNHSTLRTVQRELNDNAMSIHSNGGDGRHGHLSLILAPAAYTTISATPCVPPVKPPLIPNTTGFTGPQISEAHRLHTSNSNVYNLYVGVEQALKKQILAAVHPSHIRDLQHRQHGFATVTALQLMAFLTTTFGTITPADLDENLKRMKMPRTPPTPLGQLFTRISSGQDYAADSGDPISNSSAIRIAYRIIDDTNAFIPDCREWRQKTVANQTMTTFRAHFRAADLDRRNQLTTSEAGYHGANNIQPAPPASRPPSKPSSSTPTTTSYCHTHGSSKNLAHTSQTCRNKGPDHQDTATFANKMGGSTKVWTGRARK